MGLMVDSAVNQATYRFTMCGSRGREGPTMMECIQHYCNNGSLVCGHLLNEGTRGSQIFVVPRSGNYTVTIAGASGGHGVCSNYSGLGVIARNAVQFRRGERLRILVGQQGVSACDGHQDVDVCQLANDRVACENLWYTTYSDISNNEYIFFDGGGGGGGASLLENVNIRYSPIVIAPGGGGSGAIFNLTSFFSISNIMYNDFDEMEIIYQNFSYGHVYESPSQSPVGSIGTRTFRDSAAPGAGYYSDGFFPRASDPDPLSRNAYGGEDCSEYVRTIVSESLLFTDTHGGFGGGGGGCNGGGGGGGYTGGSITVFGETIPGEGGYSWPNPPWPLIGYNDGDGYVELFLESCGCTYYCNMLNESSFECSCPPDTSLAPNGLDCYKEEKYFADTDMDWILLSHPIYGEVTANIVTLNNTLFAYSTAVLFSNDSSSNHCAVLFVNNMGNVTAVTRFINRSSDVEYLLPFLVATLSPTLTSLFMNNDIVLLEPISIASVITFGIGGDCLLEELIINASIDDIYEIIPAPDQLFNLSSTTILTRYLDLFMSMMNDTYNITVATDSTDDESSLSAGAIFGIVISVCAVIMSMVVVMLIVTVFYYHHYHHYHHKQSHLQYEVGMETVVSTNFTIDQEDEIDKTTVGVANPYEVLHPTNKDVQQNIEMSDLQKDTNGDSTLKYGMSAPLQDYYNFNCSRQDDWSYDRAKLIYMRDIGEGQFGKVLLMSAKDICDIQGSVLVAVKTLTSRNPKDISRFLEEVNLMKRFVHPNIVSLLGHCEATSDGAPLMILELMQYGDLKWFLQANKPTNDDDTSVITDSVAFNIANDIASGLEYLTTNKYVHRDVAARNCLIGENFTAKLSDFGLARGVHEKDYYKVVTSAVLPVRWLAPESLLYGKFTSASDVWSYGVLVWEIMTFGETPYEGRHMRDFKFMTLWKWPVMGRYSSAALLNVVRHWLIL
ncbi:tyrosine-protein kinase receptor-like isoform X2 [Dysidea avara]|uniref:tyrosine-protein kinase receptor-like isoform X2 n=1 Tax=Dysidea avara TaxID=196820 RepID=UPI0033205F0C